MLLTAAIMGDASLAVVERKPVSAQKLERFRETPQYAKF